MGNDALIEGSLAYFETPAAETEPEAEQAWSRKPCSDEVVSVGFAQVEAGSQAGTLSVGSFFLASLALTGGFTTIAVNMQTSCFPVPGLREGVAGRTMRDRPGIRRRRRFRLTPRFGATLAVALLVYAGATYAAGYVRIIRLERKIQGVESAIGEARTRNAQLRAELEMMGSEEYIERVARERLRLVEPGDTVYMVTDPVAPNDPYRVDRKSESEADLPLQGY